MPETQFSDPFAATVSGGNGAYGGSGSGGSRRPAAVWLALAACAVLAVLLHFLPFWLAASNTAPGWTFTGNIHSSPDFMQYRAWFRQTQQTGVLVSSKFTAEPNPPHLPVLLYYVTGQLAAWTGIAPEFVFIGIGGVFALAFACLLFFTVRLFLPDAHQWRWALAVLFFSGGLGGYLKLLGRFPAVQKSFLGKTLIIDPMTRTLVFEDYRGHYIVSLWGDTHHLLTWLVAVLAVLALYFAWKQPSFWRLTALGAAFAAAPVIHVYEGVTLLMITAATALLLWKKNLMDRARLKVPAIAGAAVAFSLASLWMIQRASGLPVTDWRPIYILPSIVLIAFPLAWLVIGFGLGRYWRTAGLNECFLLGWALGCTVLTLSGPFYPFPDRGAMTLHIPLYLIAAAIYFSWRPRMTLAAIAVTFLLLGVTPLWKYAQMYNWTQFRETAPFMFLGGEHQKIIDAIRARAARTDILLADLPDLLWLAHEYPGVHYCGHFFLTVDYERKRTRVEQLYASTNPAAIRDLLKRERIRHIFFASTKDASVFRATRGVTAVAETGAGTLFEFDPGS